MAPEARTLLERYVSDGKLMQLATIGDMQSPLICHVWYQSRFAPDRLSFISRFDRRHSVNLRQRPAVAGGIVNIALTGLGQQVRGVTFEGTARELPVTGIDDEIAAFIGRWSAASSAIDTLALAKRETPTRLYEISVTSWVLFDEVNFPREPRQVIPALLHVNPAPLGHR